jgi:chain length determinant protein tyrosine kinase EpsG
MATELRVKETLARRKHSTGLSRGRPPEALLGALLVADGVLSELDVDKVLLAQRENGLRFGEAAMRLGLVGEHHVRAALAVQFDYPHPIVGTAFDARLFAACDPFGPQAEALRELRSELTLRWFNERHKMLAIVAARAGAGCSSIAANLAVAFAQVGERTLLIDANLRSPRQAELFAVGGSPGLTGVLGGRVSIKEAISHVSGFDRLSVLTAGPGVPNPQELLSRVPFSYVMETLPSGFDLVIVDTPPVLDCADAQIVAAHAGGCVLVARRHATRLNDISKCRRRLEPSNAAVLGLVINE